MKHLRPANRKAARIAVTVRALDEQEDVVALQQAPHIPMGCSIAFYPGWEVDSAGGTAGLCQPVERDIFDCYVTCFWPIQVADHVNYNQDWTAHCGSAVKDWRSLDLVSP